MRRQVLMFAVCALTIVGSAGVAQTSKGKPGARPKPPTNQATRPPVKGTTQLAGDNGKIGQTYTLGKADGAYNITFTKIEYNADRLMTADDTTVPEANEKLLVLHYTVQNPTNAAKALHARIFRFTAYDAESVTYSFHGDENVSKDPTGDATASMLQPAQKVAVMTWMRVPAKVAIVKLMTEIIDVTPVLRIQLTPKDVVALAPPFADPATPDGSVALAEIKGDAAAPIHLGPFDATVGTVSYADVDPGGYEIAEPDTHQYAIITVQVKNSSRFAASAGWLATVRTTGGDKANRDAVYKLNVGEDPGQPKMEPGEEAGFRMTFKIPKPDTIASVTLWYEENGRRTTIPLK